MKSAGNVLLARMPPTLAGGDEDRVGLRLRHETVDRVRLPQVEIAPRGKDDVAIFAFEPPHDCGADHAGVTGDKDALAA